MEEISAGPGAMILSIALAAGFVAFLALILKLTLGAIKAVANNFKGED